MSPVPSQSRRLEDYRPPSYRIKHVDLDFTLHYTRSWVGATLFLYRDANTAYGADLVLDGEDLELRSVTLKTENDTTARPLRLEEEAVVLSDGRLRIQGSLLPERDDEVFEISTVVVINPTTNTELSGLYKSDEVLCTQCEAEGFRRITYYLDRPDVMATFRTILRAPVTTFPVLLSNGNQLDPSKIPEPSYTSDAYRDVECPLHAAMFEDPFPKPSYLFALVAGELSQVKDSFVTCSNDTIDLMLWCEAKDKDKLYWSLESVKKAMKWDEEKFGRIFDLNAFHLVAISHFNMGAMENKGLNLFNASCLLASKDTATDQDYERVMAIVGHEYFHNWTGNRVTCRDWFQLTLKEGLTVYRDQTFSRDLGSAAVVRIQNVLALRSLQFTEDAGPLSHPIRPLSYVSPDNFYTWTVYKKGAEVVRMYATLLGENGFRKGMDLYFERHDGQAVTCDDFRAAMADANHKNLSQFARWYSQAGTPVVTVLGATYDPTSQEYKLTLQQELPSRGAEFENEPLHIPVSVGLIGRHSKRDVVPTHVLELTAPVQEFVIHHVTEEPVPSVLRNFSAPVKLRFPAMTDEEYGFLMAYDTDAINRWDSGQKLFTKAILTTARALQEGVETTAVSSDTTLASMIHTAFAQILNAIDQDNNDLSFLAYMITLPNIHMLMNEMEPCDPVLLRKAQVMMRQHLFRHFAPQITAKYEWVTAKLQGKPYKIHVADIGLRKLRNTLLFYLTTDGDTTRAFQQYMAADNLTERAGALLCLADHVGAETRHCEEAFSHFLEHTNGDASCLDKWFTFQATADHPAVIDTVERLVVHELFDWANPNRVRSLVHAFANNLGHFHRSDGRGYNFVADCVMQLDRVNSRGAARLATTLISYKTLPSERQALVRAALKRIMDMPELSSHTAEIVSKGLA